MFIEKKDLEIVDTSKPTVKDASYHVEMWTNYHIEIERDWSGMTDEAIREVFDKEFDESFNEYSLPLDSELEIESVELVDIEDAMIWHELEEAKDV